MQHYIVQAIIHGRIADSQFDEALETLTRQTHLKGMHAFRLQGRSVIRNLTFIEVELLVQPDVDAHDIAALITETLVHSANENLCGDNEAELQRIRDALAGPHDSRWMPNDHRNIHRPKTNELLYAEGFHLGDANQPEPLTLLQGNAAQNALMAETWRALLEPFKLPRPIPVGQLS